MTIAEKCSRRFRAVHTSGTRDVARIRWIVLHDTEGPSAASAAAWFENWKSGGSAHLCVDDSVCYRTLNNEDIAWGAPGANEAGFHIEQAGYARWSAVLWSSHLRTLQRAAYKTALHCHVFDLPPKFVTAYGLRHGWRGITTHAECSKAFGGDHSDPGPFWPRRLFMFYVRRYYDELAT